MTNLTNDTSNTNINLSPAPVPASKPQRRRRWPVLILAAVVALIVLGGVSFAAATALEEHDTFCISCHTVPELTYYNRAYISVDNPRDMVTDLATAHYQLAQLHNQTPFACIDCHRGDSSLGHRVSTLALGGRDALIYVLGKEDPTIEKTQTKEGWLPNAACTTCHTDTLLTLKGLDNHFHNHLPQAAQALASGGTLKVGDKFQDKRDDLLKKGLKTINTALVCSDCHLAHKSVALGANVFFMETDRRNQACVTCHQAAKEGPQDIANLK